MSEKLNHQEMFASVIVSNQYTEEWQLQQLSQVVYEVLGAKCTPHLCNFQH